MLGIKKSWMELLGSCVCMVCVVVAFTPRPAQTQDVGTLIGQLRSSSATERARAACDLGRMRVNDIRLARDELLALLADGTEVEGRLCRDYARGWWSRGRFYVSSPGREAAIALEELGTEVLDPLIDRLQGQDPVGRENAALALGLIESSQALESLSDVVRQDVTAPVRARAAWAIGMIEDFEGVDPLSSALEDASAGVREQAAWGLGMIESRSGVEGLIPVLLEDPSPEVREQAAWALGMIESSAGVAGLAVAIGDEDAEVRERAAWALGMIESRSAVDGLIPVLLEDPSPEVREQAAWALGMIEDPAAAEALVEALEDEDPSVRRRTMWALGMVIRHGGFEDIDRGELADAVRRAIRRDL